MINFIPMGENHVLQLTQNYLLKDRCTRDLFPRPIVRHFPTTCSYQGLKARDAGNHFLQPIVNHFLAACTTCISASGELKLSKEAINNFWISSKKTEFLWSGTHDPRGKIQGFE